MHYHMPVDVKLPTWQLFYFVLFVGVTGELPTLRQMMKVPNEPGLSLNNGLENAFLSDGASKTFWRQDDQPC